MSAGLSAGSSRFVPDGSGDRASVARVLLAYSENTHTFAADRAVSSAVAATWPGVVAAARAHRGFLARAVELAAVDGPAQLLDVGAGIAHDRDVPHLMRSRVPEARMVIVDHDPVAVAHHRYVWDADPGVAVVNADAMAPGEMVARVEASGVVDFSRPVLVVLGLLLHFATDEQAHALVSALRERMVPGSLLAVSHVTDDPTAPEAERAAVREVLGRYYVEAIGTPVTQRAAPWLGELMRGLVLYHPGITDAAVWAHSSESDAPSGGAGNERAGNEPGSDELVGVASSFVLGAVGFVPFSAAASGAGV